MNKKIKFMGKEKNIDMFCMLSESKEMYARLLCKRVNITDATGYRIIHQMEDAGLIVKEISGKIQWLKLTKKGKKLKKLFLAIEKVLENN